MARQGQASEPDYEIISHADMRRWQIGRHGLAILNTCSIGIAIGLLVIGAYVLAISIRHPVDPLWLLAAILSNPLVFRSNFFYVMAPSLMLIMSSAAISLVGFAACAVTPSRNGAAGLAIAAMLRPFGAVPTLAYALFGDADAFRLLLVLPVLLVSVFGSAGLFIRQVLKRLGRDRLARHALRLVACGVFVPLTIEALVVLVDSAFVVAAPIAFLALDIWWLWLLRQTRQALDADMADWPTQAQGIR